eukprot:COSAG04_NODE_30539_length_262_cov_0.631902_1_plen_29_part_10
MGTPPPLAWLAVARVRWRSGAASVVGARP